MLPHRIKNRSDSMNTIPAKIRVKRTNKPRETDALIKSLIKLSTIIPFIIIYTVFVFITLTQVDLFFTKSNEKE